MPFGYAHKENKNKKYPVLYLNDAPYTFKVATAIAHRRELDRAIIVGISRAHDEHYQYSRVRDLTPEYDKDWKEYKTGGANDYLKFIEKEVFEFIEKNYRADSSRRILSGHSLGGSFGAWVLLTKPQLFSNYILTSPSLWYKNDMIFDLEEAYSNKNKALNANVFIATGVLETPEHEMKNNMVVGHKKFLQRLTSRNYQGLHLQSEIVSGTDHDSTFPVGLSKGLRWIYKELKITDLSNI